MKFLILSIRQISGGSIALHALCRELTRMGIDARILYVPGRGYKPGQSRLNFWLMWGLYNVRDGFRFAAYSLCRGLGMGARAWYHDYFYEPVRGCRRKWLPTLSEDTVVVYPDIFGGNVLNAKKTVRWLLYFNRFPGDSRAYGKDDLFFCYRQIFNDASLNPEGRTLCLQNFDDQLYRQTYFGERKGRCYIVRKGAGRQDCPNTFDGPVIDDWSEERKVQALNRYKYCYFYDTQTFYTAVAAVCGCIPVVVLEPGKTKQDYLGAGDAPVGVAYGDTPDEIEYAVQTRGQCVRNLKSFAPANHEAVQDFIQICQAHFKSSEETENGKGA